MKTNEPAAPRVARIEVHYEDGSKDVMITAPKHRTEIPLYVWSRSSPLTNFTQHAYTSTAVATVLFQTALTRQLMPPSPRDKDTLALTRGFAHVWHDSEYPPQQPDGGEAKTP